MRWSDTSNGGATITLALADYNDLEVFKRMTIKKGGQAGQRLACVMVEINDQEEAVEQPPAENYGKAYQKLFRNGFFNNPAVKRGFGRPMTDTPEQIKTALYSHFNVTSLADVNPADFLALCNKRGIARHLPKDFL